jgi:hypothetical protein
MIESISSGIAFIALLTIFVMLALCIDVIKSSLALLKSTKPESIIQMATIPDKREIIKDKKIVYPFYVDYSVDIDPHQKYSSTL